MQTRQLSSTSTLVVGIALSLGITLGLSACITPPELVDPSSSPSASASGAVDDPATDPSTNPDGAPDAPGSGGPNPDQPIDPNHPWPSDVPRPPGTVVSESSAPNPLGEGSIWNIVFSVSSVAETESYVTQLLSSGWAFLDDREYPQRGANGSISWSLSKGSTFAELASKNGAASPVIFEFSILGF